MEFKRQIVVGDIHGCLQEFEELLLKVQFRRDFDRLVLLGDLIDRGPDGIGVIRRARELGAESVLGNHDEKHLRFRRHEENRRRTGRKNPMKPFEPARLRENEALSDEDVAWMKSLPITLNLGNNWVAVHGGFQPKVSMHDQRTDRMIRMRFVDKDTLEPVPLDEDFSDPPNSVFWALEWTGPEHVMYGHAVHGEQPLHTRKKVEPPFEVFRDSWPEEVQTLGLDTGCCFGGRLSAAVSTDEFRTWEIVQVEAKQIYREIPGGVKTMMGRSPHQMP